MVPLHAEQVTRPRALACGLLLLLTAAPAEACSRVIGIPRQCARETWLVSSGAPPRLLAEVGPDAPTSFHTYHVSPDGAAVILDLAGGIEVHFAGRRRRLALRLPLHGTHSFGWHPDRRRVVLKFLDGERQEQLAVLDLRRLEDDVPWDVLESPPGGGTYGSTLAPNGEALFLLSRRFEEQRLCSVIERLDLARDPGGGARTEVLRVGGMIDFVSLPRVEGSAAPRRPTELLVGHPRGLWLLDGDGRKRAWSLERLPAAGLQDVEWSPTGGRVLAYYRHAMSDREGVRYKGVYLLPLDRSAEPEALYPHNDVHTIWWSPDGRLAGWATPKALHVKWVDREGPAEALPIELREGEEIEGFAWRPHGAPAVAVALGSRLLLHELGGASRELATFPSERAFIADPTWVGEHVLVSRFRDLSPEEPLSERFKLDFRRSGTR